MSDTFTPGGPDGDPDEEGPIEIGLDLDADSSPDLIFRDEDGDQMAESPFDGIRADEVEPAGADLQPDEATGDVPVEIPGLGDPASPEVSDIVDEAIQEVLLDPAATDVVPSSLEPGTGLRYVDIDSNTMTVLPGAIDADHDSIPDTVVQDTNADGRPDTWFQDFDQDRDVDTVRRDTTGDGVPDTVLRDPYGQGEWRDPEAPQDLEEHASLRFVNAETGTTDMVPGAVDTDGDRIQDTIPMDTDQDGRPDIWARDMNQDGTVDLIQKDNDADGKPDVQITEDIPRSGDWGDPRSLHPEEDAAAAAAANAALPSEIPQPTLTGDVTTDLVAQTQYRMALTVEETWRQFHPGQPLPRNENGTLSSPDMVIAQLIGETDDKGVQMDLKDMLDQYERSISIFLR